MTRTRKLASALVAVLGIGGAAATAVAQPGPTAGPMMHGDAAFRADMGLVHQMLEGHGSIRRTVTNLADGIRTVTESDDPKVSQVLIAHVASMEQRKKDGREFNLFSPTIPVLFENRTKIRTVVETTAKGVRVTQTATDPKLVAALQAHAGEVSELARDGRAAMMRGMQARMGHRHSMPAH